MKIITAFASALVAATLIAGCTSLEAMDARQIEDQYGLLGAYTGSIVTSDGPLKGTLVPITLPNGRQGHLLIPQRQPKDSQAVYLQDEQGLHPMRLGDNVAREQLTRSAAIVETRAEPMRANKRSWEREAVIIGGSAGAGTAIGAMIAEKGTTSGAAAGGVGGLIYDLMTRNK